MIILKLKFLYKEFKKLTNHQFKNLYEKNVQKFWQQRRPVSGNADSRYIRPIITNRAFSIKLGFLGLSGGHSNKEVKK